jgi:hypothetical protein
MCYHQQSVAPQPLIDSSRWVVKLTTHDRSRQSDLSISSTCYIHVITSRVTCWVLIIDMLGLGGPRWVILATHIIAKIVRESTISNVK